MRRTWQYATTRRWEMLVYSILTVQSPHSVLLGLMGHPRTTSTLSYKTISSSYHNFGRDVMSNATIDSISSEIHSARLASWPCMVGLVTKRAVLLQCIANMEWRVQSNCRIPSHTVGLGKVIIFARFEKRIYRSDSYLTVIYAND